MMADYPQTIELKIREARERNERVKKENKYNYPGTYRYWKYFRYGKEVIPETGGD
ncbi:MAG: hypothetical protein U5P10_00015 [Spirochaetia bacterium]|nr:hypothetical protein [Spirochaetia bacterium]